MKLLADFFPVILFFVAYKLFGIYVATMVAIAASALQVAWVRIKHKRTERMHLITLGLLVVFGGLTLALRDPIFVMRKPTIVDWLFAVAFLGSQFIGKKTLVERMMSQAIDVPAVIWRRLNLAWTGFFLFSGLANLYVVYVASGFFQAKQALVNATGEHEVDLSHCAELFNGAQLLLCETAHASEELWVNFKLFGMMGLTIVFVIAQAFYVARHLRDDDPGSEPGSEPEQPQKLPQE
jgi:intracellular septation protein